MGHLPQRLFLSIACSTLRRAFRRAVAPAAELRAVRLFVTRQKKLRVLGQPREALAADHLGGPGEAEVGVVRVLHRAHAVLRVVRKRTGVRARRAGPTQVALARHRGPADAHADRGSRQVNLTPAPDERRRGFVLLVG